MNAEHEETPSLEHQEKNLRKLNLNYEELLKLTASLMIEQRESELFTYNLERHLIDTMSALSILKHMAKEGGGYEGEQMLAMLANADNKVAKGLLQAQKYQKTKQARNAALVRLKDDPKQKALKEIEAKYQDVKHIMHLHGRSAQFAREMHAKYSIFDDIATINRLVAKLNKSNELIPKK